MDKIKNLSLDQKAKLYFMGMVKAGLIDTLPENPKAAFVQQMMDGELEKLLGKEEDPRKLGEMKVTDKDGNDVTRDVIAMLKKDLEKSGYTFITKPKKEKDVKEAINSMGYEPLGYYTDQGEKTKENPEDIEYYLKQIEGMSLDDATRFLGLEGLSSSMTYKILKRHNTDVIDTFDDFSDTENPFQSSRKNVGQLNPDDLYEDKIKDLSLEEIATELGYLNESIGVNLKDLTFDMVTKVFKDEYENKNPIAFPNADDSLLRVRNESDFNNWKANTMEKFGNVQVQLKPEADVWFDKVKIMGDEFKAAQDKSDTAKQSFIDSEREAGRSID